MSDQQMAFLDSIAHGGPIRLRFWDGIWWAAVPGSVDLQQDLSDMERRGLIEVSGSVPAITVGGLAALSGQGDDDL